MSNTHTLPANPALHVPGLTKASDRNLARAKWGYLSLLVFTAILFGRPEDFFPALQRIPLAQIFGICAGLAYVLALLSGKAPLIWTRELKIVLALTVWYIAGVAFAFWRTNSLDTLTHVWLKTLLIFFLLTQTVLTLDRIRKLLWVILLCELVVAALSVYEPGAAVTQEGTRLSGVSLGFLSGNYLGIAAGMTFPYVGALLVTRRSLVKSGLLVATFGLVMWMLVLTASRGGVLSVFVSIALTWFLVLDRGLRARMFGLAFVIVVLVSLLLAPTIFWDRVSTIWDRSGSPTSGIAVSAYESEWLRKDALRHSIEYTLQHPIFGVGLGNFNAFNGNTQGRASAWLGTHNMYTQVSSEAGIPALVLYVGLIVVLIRNGRRIGRVQADTADYRELAFLARATLASIYSFLFAGCFAHVAYDYYFYYVVAIGISLQLIARRTSMASAMPVQNGFSDSAASTTGAATSTLATLTGRNLE